MPSAETPQAAAYDQGARDAIDVLSFVIGFCTEKHGRLLHLSHEDAGPAVYHFEDGTEVFFVRDDLHSVGRIIGDQRTQFYFGVRHGGEEDWTYRALTPGPQG